MVSDNNPSRRTILEAAGLVSFASLAGCLGGDSSGTGGGQSGATNATSGGEQGQSGTLGDWSLDVNAPDPVLDRITGAEWTSPEFDDGEVAGGFQRLNLGGMQNDPATAWFQDYFNEKTGITPTAVTVPSSDAVSQMRTQLSSQSGDVTLLQLSQEFFMNFARQGWLEPVDELWPEGSYEPFPPYFKDELTTDLDRSLESEHTYMSVAISEAHALNYNSAVLEELGFPSDFYDGATWADIREVCEEATSHSGDYQGWVWYGSGNRYPVYPWLRQTWSRGGTIVQDDGSVVFNSDAGVAALEWQSQMIADELLPDVLQYGEGGPVDLFLGGGLAGFGGGLGIMPLALEQWGGGQGQSGNATSGGGQGQSGNATSGGETNEYNMALLPRGENGEHVSYMNTDFLAINRFASPENKRAAMLYMDGRRSAIASAQDYDQEGNYPPNTAAWDHELLADANFRETAQQVAETARVELWPNQIETFDVLVTNLQEAWLGNVTPQEALDSVQSEVDNIMSNN